MGSSSSTTTVDTPATTGGPSTTNAPVEPPTTPSPTETGDTEPASPPMVSVPGAQQAAPFSPASPTRPDGHDEPPGWLVALAVGALLGAGGATSATGWRLGRRDPERTG